MPKDERKQSNNYMYFQEISVLAVHLIGAGLAFGLGTIYEIIQCFITYKMHPEVNGKYIFHVRLTLAILSVLILIGGK